MRKGVIKITVLLLVAAATVVFMGLFNHQSRVDLTFHPEAGGLLRL